jgi:hypothetical protein
MPACAVLGGVLSSWGAVTCRPCKGRSKNGLEGSKNRRSSGGHGNQHVRLRGSQITACDNFAISAEVDRRLQRCPQNRATTRSYAGHLRNIWPFVIRDAFGSFSRQASSIFLAPANLMCSSEPISLLVLVRGWAGAFSSPTVFEKSSELLPCSNVASSHHDQQPAPPLLASDNVADNL